MLRTFPDEVLEPLAQRLPVLDVVRLASVSRAWRAQLGRAALIERVRLDGCPGPSSIGVPAWLARNLPRIRELELANWHTLPLLAPAPATKASSRPLRRPRRQRSSSQAALGLVRLVFNTYHHFELPSLASCTALRELSIVGCALIQALPPLDALAQLTRLEVIHCRHLTQFPALNSCFGLVELHVAQCQYLASLPSLASCTALKALAVIRLQREDDSSEGTDDFDGEDIWYNALALPEDVTALTGLTSLQLQACKGEVVPRLDACPRLRSLDIQSCNVSSQLLGLTACRELEKLRVAFCCIHEGDLLGAQLPPLPALPALRSLHLSGYNSTFGRFPTGLGSLTRLTRLQLSSCHLELAQLAPVSVLASLAHLEIQHCSGLSEFPSLASCGQLQRLHVADCDDLLTLPDLSGCMQLQELECSSLRQVQELPSLASCCGQLKLLKLKDSREWVALPDLSGCTRLEVFECWMCHQVQELPSLASCGQLRHLRIFRCERLLALPDLSSCTQLKELECTRAYKLQQLPSLASCGQLQALRMVDCDDLLALPDLSGCTQLEELYLGHCTRLQGLPDLAACTALRRLEVVLCDALSEAPGFQESLDGLRSRNCVVVNDTW